ncbi:MAG: hypothetical protein HUJ65_01640, partial [Oscillospiraceae bacterium]|nr:hypothetical protein [Oscillospiraceae bacterium]
MNIIANFISELNRDKMLRRKTIRIIVVLSLIITAFVFWQLRVIGIAMTDEACCGLTEHTHDESCASARTLICELEESETLIYSCGYEDGEEISLHSHDDECFDGDALICELPETLTHYHMESCSSTSAHTHTDECYRIIYNCGSEPHVHTLECYTDPNADVETAADWEKTIPELKDDWAIDLVSVAESQVGYAESSKNVEFDVLEDESLIRRCYTRYGAWYGEDRDQPFRYIDNWSAVFASFCLHYAGIPVEEAPQNLGCSTMMQDWQKIERFGASEDYSPTCGDLVFLDKDGNGIADSIGIISDIDDDGFKAIEGSSNDCVEKNAHSFDDEAILGYGMLPEMPAEEIVEEDIPE